MEIVKKITYNNTNKRKNSLRFINMPILFCVLFLSFFGVVMIYSASSYSAGLTYGDPFFFARKQLYGVIIGLVCCFVLYKIDFNALKKYGLISLILSLALLALVFMPGLSRSNYGATRWIGVGSFTIQPSEFAKFGLVIFCSAYLAKNHENMHKFKSLLPILLGGGLMCVLIMLEPNMSITMCVGATFIFMLFVGGTRLKHLLMLAVPILFLIPLLIIAEPYRLKRLLAFLDPWSSAQDEGFQLVQSLYSLGSGGWFGVGLFNSRQKHLFLPFSESDFIFSIIGEELGLLGCLAIIIVFMVFIFYGFKIAKEAPNRFGSLLASGITFVIAVQVILNIAVVTGSIPPTGLPLPFISAGGTSIVVFLASIGILLNIHKQSQIEREEGIYVPK